MVHKMFIMIINVENSCAAFFVWNLIHLYKLNTNLTDPKTRFIYFLVLPTTTEQLVSLQTVVWCFSTVTFIYIFFVEDAIFQVLFAVIYVKLIFNST